MKWITKKQKNDFYEEYYNQRLFVIGIILAGLIFIVFILGAIKLI